MLTTHYLEEADALADRIAVIDGGALVALGTPTELKAGVSGTPVMVVELYSGQIPSGKEKQQLIDELLALGQEYEHTQGITEFLFHDSFPVDVRHNVKIQREKLAAWAEKKLK